MGGQIVSQPDYPSALLENPIHIMRHILTEELGVDDFDESEYQQAVEEHIGWKFAFSVNESINAKNLIESISKSTFSLPRIKSDNKFGFVTIKETYTEDDYNAAITIHETDIINYQFNLTSSDKIITGLNIEYDYDYGSKKLVKNISEYDGMAGFDSNINNVTASNKEITDFQGLAKPYDYDDIISEESLELFPCFKTNMLNFSTNLIKDEDTVRKFKIKKFHNEKTQHLIIDITLGISYSELEVGSLIKFPKDKLIDNIKAYGMDYTNPIGFGGSYRYPLFLVNEVKRDIDTIKISCYQLHGLKYDGWAHRKALLEFAVPVDIGNYSFFGGDGTNTLYIGIPPHDPFWNIENFPNIDLDDPIYTDQEDTDFNLDIGDITESPYYGLHLNIGYNSETELEGGTILPSSYSREFKIFNDDNLSQITNLDSESNLYVLGDNMELLFEEPFLFGEDDWLNLIPQKNSDDSGYGSILNGDAHDKVGGFVAMEVRMVNYGGIETLLRLQNIKGTEFP